ncbi:hypothetical protein EYF80_045618 [Liparis tanakae]|uniref:Uncharacterized protein n=1 Tax=Liparis tanakae TaxID=230148 RepID=A0A4Z2FTS2_9TELE|nr:hypothetical protein EYF80_045618 [Liparis tanakae]
MRECLAPKARCIYLGNDSHLDRQGVCPPRVSSGCFCLLFANASDCCIGGCRGNKGCLAFPRRCERRNT